MRRKILSILLVLCMVLTLLPASVLAAEEGETETSQLTIEGLAASNTQLYNSKTVADLGKMTLTAEEDETGKYSLTGYAKYVDMAGFNSSVTNEQKGHYVVISVKGTANAEFTTTNASSGAKSGKTLTLDSEGTLDVVIWLDGEYDSDSQMTAKTFKFVQGEGDGAVEYIVDYSQLVLLPETGPDFAAAELNEIGADFEEGKPTAAFQNLTLGNAGDKDGYVAVYHPTGTVKYVEGWTSYWPGNTEQQSGYYVAIKASNVTEVESVKVIEKTAEADSDGAYVALIRLGGEDIRTNGGKVEGNLGFYFDIDGAKYAFIFDQVILEAKDAEEPTGLTISLLTGSDVLFDGVKVSDLGTMTLTAAESEGNTYTLSGTANYVEMPSFNTAVKAEQEGHYVAIKVSGGTANGSIVAQNVSDGAGNEGKTLTLDNNGEKEILVWLDGTRAANAGKTFSITTGTGDDAVEYTINFSGLTLKDKEAEGPDLTSATVAITKYEGTDDFWGKTASDMGDFDVGEMDANKTIKVTGTANYISDYTGFNSDTTEQNGHYLPINITVTLPKGETTYGKVTVVGKQTKELTIDNTGLQLVMRLDALAEKKFTVTYGKTTYTVDVSGVTLQAKDAPAKTLTIDLADDETEIFGGKKVAALGEMKLDKTTLKLTGSANYVEQSGFNTSVPAEEKGHYVAIKVTGTKGQQITLQNVSSGASGAGKTLTLPDDGVKKILVWLDGDRTGNEKKTFTITTGEGAALETYVIDFTDLILLPEKKTEGGVTIETKIEATDGTAQVVAEAKKDGTSFASVSLPQSNLSGGQLEIVVKPAKAPEKITADEKVKAAIQSATIVEVTVKIDGEVQFAGTDDALTDADIAITINGLEGTKTYHVFSISNTGAVTSYGYKELGAEENSITVKSKHLTYIAVAEVDGINLTNDDVEGDNNVDKGDQATSGLKPTSGSGDTTPPTPGTGGVNLKYTHWQDSNFSEEDNQKYYGGKLEITNNTGEDKTYLVAFDNGGMLSNSLTLRLCQTVTIANGKNTTLSCQNSVSVTIWEVTEDFNLNSKERLPEPVVGGNGVGVNVKTLTSGQDFGN